MDKKLLKLFVFFTLISFVIGGLSGLISSIFILPSFMKSDLAEKLYGSKVIYNKTIVELDYDSATIEAVKKATPAVVSIVVTKELSNFYNITGPFWFFGNNFIPDITKPKQKQKIGGGTGFIVTTDGLILTNKHVVSDDTAEYTVVLNDERKFQAKVLAKDPINDLAVIKIDGENLPTISLGDSSQIEIGQTVIAIGYTLSEYSNTVTRGVISGVNRTLTASDGYFGSEVIIEEALQTDAAINPGNSGGPLLNLQGEVIGINTAVNREGEAIGFALPINIAKKVIDSVQKYGKIVRPYLGIRYVQLNEKIAKANNLSVNYGAIILRGQNPEELAVIPGSPADKAGLVENDIILEINGKKLDRYSLAYELQRYNVGDEITLKVLHKGEEKTVKVKLEERK